jgi:hypothetical protein
MKRQLTLVGRVVRELALGAVYDHAGDQVTGENENLGNDEALPEVISADKTSQLDSINFHCLRQFHVRSSHLSHEFIEERCSTLGKHTVHEPIDAVIKCCSSRP